MIRKTQRMALERVKKLIERSDVPYVSVSPYIPDIPENKKMIEKFKKDDEEFNKVWAKCQEARREAVNWLNSILDEEDEA